MVAAGLVIGLRPLADNSFFTHLATGRVILDTASVPATDPYTFTAPGEPWLVQSWLASTLYAFVERIAGAEGLRLLMGATAALLAALGWRLTRPAASLLPRLLLGVVFVAVGAGLWTERPLMIGLVALALVVLAGEGALAPVWLAPVAWVWVNSHGSFPLGLAYLAVLALGARLDGRDASLEWRALRWLLVGVLLGAVGPLGLGALTFPFELLQRQEILSNVIEWRAPAFDSLSQRMFLFQLILVMVAIARRPSYRHALVAAVFTAAALLGSRNVPVASVTFLPILASAAPEWGSLRAAHRRRVGALLAACGVLVAAALAAERFDQRDFELRGYPIDVLAHLDEADIDLTKTRMATRDIVGNALELIYGARQQVFYDDRFDMFPDDVSRAHLALVNGGPSMRAELERHQIDLVAWERGGATAQRLVVDPDWRVLYTDESWILVCRRGSGRPTSC